MNIAQQSFVLNYLGQGSGEPTPGEAAIDAYVVRVITDGGSVEKQSCYIDYIDRLSEYTLALYTTEVEALLPVLSTNNFAYPTPSNLVLIGTLIDDLKDAGAWALADFVALYGTDAVTGNVGRINLVKPSDPLGSYVNAITYNRKQGVKGDGVSAYVDTAFNPSSYSGRKYVVGNNTNGVWVYSAASGIGTAAVTAGYLANQSYRLLNTNTASHRIHSANTGTANLSGTGWEVGYKTGAGAVTLMNGPTTELAVTGLLDNAIPDETRKLFVTSGVYSNAGVSILIMGANMLSVNTAINTAITNYMNALALLP